jgi:crossover junction endodeoxyribonuclease RusA
MERLVPTSTRDLALEQMLSSQRRRRPALPPFAPSLGKATVLPDSLRVILPLPPSINHQYATVNGRRVLSAMGRSFKAQVAQHILLVLARSPHRGALLQTLGANPLALTIHFFFMSPLRRDVDGGLKIAQDALCEALDLNDNRIVEVHLRKGHDAENPRTELSLSPSIASQ